MLKKVINFITKPAHLKPNIKTIFIAIFAALSVFILIWFDNYSFELFGFKKRVLGIATLNKIDVAARLSNFYKALYSSIFSYIIFHFFANILYNLFKKIRRELLAVNYLSIAGIFILIYYTFYQNVFFSLLIVYVSILILIFTILIKLIFRKSFHNVDYNFYIWTAICGTSVTILLFAFLGSFVTHSYLLFYFIITTIFVLIFSFKNFKINYIKTLYILRPITFIPLLLFCSQEFFLILNQRNIRFLHPKYLFFIGLIIIILYSFYTFYKIKKNKIIFKKSKDIILKYYFPTIIVSFSFYVFYTPFAEHTLDMFEMANRSNSVMNLFHFGKVPVLEFLPTHLMNDLLFNHIYTLLNGYQTNFGFMAYQFIYTSISAIIFYHFLSKITTKYLSLFLSLFFPFINIIFWQATGAVVLLAPLIIYHTYQKQTFINYLLFFLVLLIEISWRPDSGFSSLIILMSGLIYVCISKYKNINFKHLIFAFLIIFVPVFLTIVAIGLIKDIDVFHNISLILEFYSSSPQARGHHILTHNHDRIFTIHHVVFPFIIALILIIIIYKNKKLITEKPFLTIALLSLIIFYFSNFQRGLTRHSFIESSDRVLTSFSYLIISLSVYLFGLKSKLLKHSLFVMLLSFLIISFKFKEVKENSNMLVSLKDKMENDATFIFSNRKIDREIIDTIEYNERVAGVKSFFDSYLPENSTFFDFSNQPTMYYYTQRDVPVFFIHFLAITNDNLQVENLKYMQNYDIPFVLFNQYPYTFWDKTDGLFNAVRYYKFAEYIYQNYKPYTFIEPNSIWKRNDFNIENNEYSNKLQPEKLDCYSLKNIPFVWANYDESYLNQPLVKEWNTFELKDSIYRTKLPNKIDKTTGNYVLITVKNKKLEPNKGFLQYKQKNKINGTFIFDILGEQEIEKYIVRISTQYRWYSCNNIGLRTYFENKKDCELINLKLLKAD